MRDRNMEKARASFHRAQAEALEGLTALLDRGGKTPADRDVIEHATSIVDSMQRLTDMFPPIQK